MGVVNGPVAADYDAVVAGSGAIGLMAALTLRAAGRSVLVVEKAPTVGGTAAVSGGMLWIPDNPSMRSLGMADDPEAALCYLQHISRGQTPEATLRGFLDSGPAMLDFAAEQADL